MLNLQYSRYDETGTNKSIRGTHNKKSFTRSEGSSAESINEYNNVTSGWSFLK